MASVVPGSTRQSTSIDRVARDDVVLHAGVDDVRADRVADQRSQGAGVHRVAHAVDGGIGRGGVHLARRDPPQDRGRLPGERLGGRLEEAGHDRRDPDRAGRGQALDRASGQDRGVVGAWHRTVAPGARDVDPVRREALLRDLDRVQPLAADRHRHATALVDGAGRLQPVRPVRGDPASAVDRPRLLVGRAGEQDVAAQARDRIGRGIEAGRARLLDQPLDDAELERDHPLHVDRAATVDVAVGDVRRERVVASSDPRRPARRRGATGGGTARRPCRRRAGGRGPSRDPGRARRPPVAGRAPVSRSARYRGDAGLAVGRVGRRRVDRRDPDEVAQRRHDRVVGGGPGRRGHRGRGCRRSGRGHRPAGRPDQGDDGPDDEPGRDDRDRHARAGAGRSGGPRRGRRPGPGRCRRRCTAPGGPSARARTARGESYATGSGGRAGSAPPGASPGVGRRRVWPGRVGSISVTGS